MFMHGKTCNFQYCCAIYIRPHNIGLKEISQPKAYSDSKGILNGNERKQLLVMDKPTDNRLPYRREHFKKSTRG